MAIFAAMIVGSIVAIIVRDFAIQVVVRVVRTQLLELLHLQLGVEKPELLHTQHNYVGHCPS